MFKLFITISIFCFLSIFAIAQTNITDSIAIKDTLVLIKKTRPKYIKPLLPSKFEVMQDTSTQSLILNVPIDTKLELIEVTNFEGQLVYKKVVEGAFSSFRLSTAYIPKGKLYVHILTSEGRFSKMLDYK